MTDLISRQAALAELDKAAWGKDWDKALAAEMLKSLPSAQQWIPCSERLPEENTPVLLGVKFKDDFKCFVTARMDFNYWQGLGRDIQGETRWMPLPEPWRGSDK